MKFAAAFNHPIPLPENERNAHNSLMTESSQFRLIYFQKQTPVVVRQTAEIVIDFKIFTHNAVNISPLLTAVKTEIQKKHIFHKITEYNIYCTKIIIVKNNTGMYINVSSINLSIKNKKGRIRMKERFGHFFVFTDI